MSSALATKLRTGRRGSERAVAASGRDTARVIVGAAEVSLLARDPHLAARAMWVLLRSDDQVRPLDGTPVSRCIG